MSLEMLEKEFLIDCQARNLSPKTISNYKKQLGYFLRFLADQCAVTSLNKLAF